MTMRSKQFRSELVAMLPRLRRFALSLARNRQDADDLVQTAVVRALTQEEAAQNAERLASWLYRIVKNLWIDERRRQAVRGTPEPIDNLNDAPGDDGRRQIEARSDLARAQRIFDRMSPELQTAAVLVIVHGLSYRAAADLLEVPIGTVMSRVSRARRALDRLIVEEPNDYSSHLIPTVLTIIRLHSCAGLEPAAANLARALRARRDVIPNCLGLGPAQLAGQIRSEQGHRLFVGQLPFPL